MNNIPNRIATQSLDRGMAALEHFCDPMIQLEMEFDGQLDAERLARAIDLSLDAEPVLGCRFVVHPRKPYWERLPKTNRDAFILTNDRQEYEVFKADSLDTYQGPQLKACLWQDSSSSCLLLKVSDYA